MMRSPGCARNKVVQPRGWLALARARFRRIDKERGSAVAEFVMISALMLVLALGVFQLAFALHVRVTLIDCAGEGARAAAAVGADLQVAKDRTRTLINTALHSSYSSDISTAVVEREGIELLEVTVQAPLPMIGFIGPGSGLTVTGHAVIEDSL